MKQVRLCIALLLLAFAVTACQNEPVVTDVSQATPQSDLALTDQDIPVEALPDPLPAPYLFVDDLTVEDLPVTETLYVVQPGDTLALIATRFCITVEEIQRLNNVVDIDALKVGQELRIPIREGACGAANPEAAQAENVPGEPAQLPGETYIVQEGDTLADIAFAYGYTWVDLLNYNGLTETQAANLKIGQVLIIPPQTAQAEEETQPAPSEPPG